MDSNITWPYQIADHNCRITWVYNKNYDYQTHLFFQKQQARGQGDHQAVARGCWTVSMGQGTHCAPRSHSRGGVNYTIECCDEELCNTGHTSKIGIIGVTVASCFLIYLFNFMKINF